ncbi:B3 domain-containing protein REM10-like [Nicotiana sylvestris]|uniref:B3 domain-containing protein REM10-like n=1 Tax=Nicotiana sylvestris TaxID=4096 RepID=UPI00388C95F0
MYDIELKKIPTGFLKYLKVHEHIERAVLRRGIKQWRVKVNGRYIEEGWEKFAEEHDLQLGDLLVFRHEGNMEFEVSIFDSSHCDREYSEYLRQQQEEANNVEEISKKFEFKEKPSRGIKLSINEDSSHAEAATYEKPFGQSHFVCTIQPYCLFRGYLSLPRQFAKANGLSNKKCDLIIKDDRQRSWKLKLSSSKSRVYMGDGWRKLVTDNCLKEGDRIRFEIATNGETPIWKSQVLTDETPIRKFQDKPSPRIKLSNKASSHAEASTKKPFGHSYFKCTLGEYCLSSGFLYLPKQFAIANGLANKCSLIIRDEKQRSWNLKLSSRKNKNEVYIGDGFHC